MEKSPSCPKSTKQGLNGMGKGSEVAKQGGFLILSDGETWGHQWSFLVPLIGGIGDIYNHHNWQYKGTRNNHWPEKIFLEDLVVCHDLSDSLLPQNQDMPSVKSVESVNNLVAIMQIIANHILSILSINISPNLFETFFLWATSPNTYSSFIPAHHWQCRVSCNESAHCHPDW